MTVVLETDMTCRGAPAIWHAGELARLQVPLLFFAPISKASTLPIQPVFYVVPVCHEARSVPLADVLVMSAEGG